MEERRGQMVTHATPAASKRYSYDALGRLIGVQGTIGGTGLCVARSYGYDERGEPVVAGLGGVGHVGVGGSG